MARISPKYSKTEIVEYSTILIIEIGLAKHSNKIRIRKGKNKKIREVKIYPYPSLSSGNPILFTKETELKIEISVGEPLAKFWLLSSVSGYVHTLGSGGLKRKKKRAQWVNPL